MSEGTREIYERARLGGSVALGKRPAVLVVDLSRGFTDPACALGSDLTGVVEATNRLLAAAREGGLPVIFTTIGFEANLKDGSLWLQKVPSLGELMIGGAWVEIDPRLGHREEETVILKKGASAFFGTNLVSVLVSQGVDTVILCGATTSGCIRATAVDLLQYGYPTLVPRECVGDRAQDPHEANLMDTQAKYADVVPLDDALSYLQKIGKVKSPARRCKKRSRRRDGHSPESPEAPASGYLSGERMLRTPARSTSAGRPILQPRGASPPRPHRSRERDAIQRRYP